MREADDLEELRERWVVRPANALSASSIATWVIFIFMAHRHFHIGSQIANIRDIHSAIRECGRHYAELRKLGVEVCQRRCGRRTRVRELLDPHIRAHDEILDELNEKLADKMFINFSLFQSSPDAWGIDQIFPVVPLTRLDQPLTERAIIQI